ncbi:hypothetical protein ACFL27_01105 [candidate division CSSED10-310 bacterium]|uniref:Uncharacterized protein n=1 Tax=candidate division CSSED10-310 bacterium TaxID=2855610 RepID=A0ABV6YRE3_UNCC1
MLFNSKRFLLPIILMFTFAVMMAGCIVIDNDDDDDPERITYHNNTPYQVENYIDDIFRGSVDAYSTLTIYGDYEGTHTYYSKALNVGWTWGPDNFSLYDGEKFTIYLDPP